MKSATIITDETPLIDENDNQASTTDITGVVITADEWKPKTILDLFDECLLRIFDFLPIKDVLNVALTCTRFEALCRQLFASEHRHYRADIVVEKLFKQSWFGDNRDHHRQTVKFLFDFPTIDIDFGSPKYSKYCEIIFRLLCKYRTRPAKKLIISYLTLSGAMPSSMITFFRMFPVAEVELFRCELSGPIEFPNVRNLYCWRHINDPALDISKYSAPQINALSMRRGILSSQYTVDIMKYSIKAAIRSGRLRCIGLEVFLQNHKHIKNLLIRDPSHFENFSSILQMENIESLNLAAQSHRKQLDMQRHFTNLKKLVVGMDGGSVWNLDKFFRQTESLECLGLFSCMTKQGDAAWNLIKSASSITNLKRLELKGIRLDLVPVNSLEKSLIELIESAPHLKAIEINFSGHESFYQFCNGEYYQFLFDLWKSNDINVKITCIPECALNYSERVRNMFRVIFKKNKPKRIII